MVARGPVEFFVDDFAPRFIVCLHGPSWSHVAPLKFLVVVGVVFVSHRRNSCWVKLQFEPRDPSDILVN